MTERQKRFCDEYLIDCNGTRAYRAAYPNVKSNDVARAAAARLLARVNDVREYINARSAEMSAEKIATAQEVMEYLTSVMRGESVAEIVAVVGVGDGVSAAQRMQKAPDEKERLKAAELLGKRFGLFTEQLQVQGAVPVIIDDSNSVLPDCETDPARKTGYERAE